MSDLTISPEDAEKLYEAADGERVGDWTRIADQAGDSGRWREQHWLVITNGAGCYGIPFAIGLTEMQDHEFPWSRAWDAEPGPIVLTALVGVDVTTTQYLTERQYEKHLANKGAPK